MNWLAGAGVLGSAASAWSSLLLLPVLMLLPLLTVRVRPEAALLSHSAWAPGLLLLVVLKAQGRYSPTILRPSVAPLHTAAPSMAAPAGQPETLDKFDSVPFCLSFCCAWW
jgi:hypothetical protein